MGKKFKRTPLQVPMPELTEDRLRLAAAFSRVWHHQRGRVNLTPTVVAAYDPDFMIPVPPSNVKVVGE